ncbi:unnamed protein product [Brachionus calyciflorus]|uniref:MULE transposase domain-containing protein n=1 Tax=Brachionus calyciflorus TaxID=104777 RepID=A0A813QGL8_9BILA|nr:unnamed protein product [Brachionus calyciflorus]
MSFEDPIFIESNFGIEKVKNSHQVVIFKNFRYWWRITNKDCTHRYVCSEINCYASIRIKEKKVIKEGGKHYHNSLTDAEIIFLQAGQDLKKEVSSDLSKSIQTCYNNTQVKLLQSGKPEYTIASKFTAFKTFSNTLHKRRGNKLPTISPDFTELEITGEYCLTAKNQAFLRYDNKKSINRILIFIDDESLKILSESDEWYMGGTFKSAPIQLSQLFTIHGSINGANEYTTVPCAYILSAQKNESTYREVISVLKDLAMKLNLTLNPKSIMADFEKASTNAMQFHFPSIVVKGCWFHFRQAIFRYAVRLGLKKHYHKDNYRDFINLFGALSFLPLEKVEEEISPRLWNHFESNVRTNNRIEGFHSGLNKMISSQHPNKFILINHLKVQQACTSIDYARIKLGQKIKEMSKKDQEKNKKIEIIKNQFKELDGITNYLLAINQFIQYPCEYWYDSPDQVDQFFNDNIFENTQDALHENLELRTESVEQCFETFVNEVQLVQDNVTFANLQTVTELPNFSTYEKEINCFQ